MTYISKRSKTYRIKVTDHTNEMSENIGFNIEGEEFIANSVDTGNVIRGYIMLPLYGMVRKMWGPVTMNADDLE